MTSYSRNDWGITRAEYEMLEQAIEQGIVTRRQVENNRYSFLWGEEMVEHFIHRLDWTNSFVTDIEPYRTYIDQDEFQSICSDVVQDFPQILSYRFEFGKFHFSFRSHSGKSRLGGCVYFNDNGYITGRNWQYSSSYDANLPHHIGKRISNKIKSALYE